MNAVERRVLALCLTGCALLGAFLFSLLPTDQQLVRLRNSFIASVGSDADFQWTPATPPAGFLLPRVKVPARFRAIAEAIEADAEPGQFPAGLAIARHLASGPGPGPGISSDVDTAYDGIINAGLGFCSDYSQVFNGIAIAMGVPVREWGMSFEEFSGIGHAFNEVYDARRGKWLLIDSYFSLYAIDSESREPLSVLELAKLLADDSTRARVEMVPIEPARFGFASSEKAREYYRLGFEEAFLVFGNNVFTYDADALVGALAPWSRGAEQLAGIAKGVYPELRILPTRSNGAAIERLFAMRWQFLGALFALLTLAALSLVILGRAWKRRWSFESRPSGV